MALAAAWIAGRAIVAGNAVHEGFISPQLLLAGAAFASAIGFWLLQTWAWRLTLAILALAAALNVWALVAEGFSWYPVVAIALLTLGVFYLWRLRRDDPDEEDDEPFLSLVLLLREPHYLDAPILANLASDAWNVEVEVAPGDDEEVEPRRPDETGAIPTLVGGAMPHFFCVNPPAFFTVYCVDEPYFDDPAEVAESVRELRAQQAIAAHQAWISVDLVQWLDGEEDREEAYRRIGRLLAELADENCLAVLDPVEGRVFVYDPETERKLRSDNPLQELQDLYYAPIATISGDDEEMKAAVAEAQRRWPEFVVAFEDRPEEDEAPFLVKAPFYHDENTEFMWVKVTGIENQVVYGRLGNEPANIPHLHEGDRVRVKEDDVNDWMCVVQGKPVGGFTLKVLGRNFEDD